MRGRVMALWAVAFLGSTPIGGPIAGWVSDGVGGRGGLVMGAIACFAAAGLGLLIRRQPDGVDDEAHETAERPEPVRKIAPPDQVPAASRP